MSLDVEGMFVKAIASDEIVNKLVGCSAAEWVAHYHEQGNSGPEQVEMALRGTVCEMKLQLPVDSRSGRDPKIVDFVPRQTFRAFHQTK